MSELADGFWCNNCGFFEEPDVVGHVRCSGCGCPSDAHLPVKVVSDD